jgi:hypothetical protein
MYSTDKKILALIDYIIYKKIVPTKKEFFKQTDIYESMLSKVKSNKAHFTPEHIQRICKVFNVNANWIMDLEKEVFRDSQGIEIEVSI